MADPKLSATILKGHVIEEAASSPKPDLANLPPTFVLATNLSESELHEVEDIFIARGAPVTYDLKAANLVIGNITKERRAKFELKRGNVMFNDYEEVPESGLPGLPGLTGFSDQVSSPAAAKRRKLNAGTLELIEDAACISNSDSENIGTDIVDIHPNEGNNTSGSNSPHSLVNMSFISKFIVHI